VFLQLLPQGSQFNVQSTDVQPSVQGNAILIFVTGQILVEILLLQYFEISSPTPFPLQIGGESNALKYCHFIQLVATGPGAYYIHNEIFRLNYA
jgi:hypothetical protein